MLEIDGRSLARYPRVKVAIYFWHREETWGSRKGPRLGSDLTEQCSSFADQAPINSSPRESDNAYTRSSEYHIGCLRF